MSVAVDTDILLYAVKETHLADLEELAHEIPEISANDVHDAYTVVLMREHNIRTILTADKGFRRFKNLEVVDPVRNSA